MKSTVIAIFLIFHLVNGIQSLEATEIEPTFVNRITNVLSRMRTILNRVVAASIESQRPNFSTGWPALGIEPIDPFYLAEYRVQPDELTGFTSIDMNLTDTYIRGLQNFEIVNVDIRPALLSAVITLSFDRLDFDGYHNTSASFLNGLFPVTANGQGPYTIRMNNIVVNVIVQFDWIDFEFIALHQLRVNYVIAPLANVNFYGFGNILGPAFNFIASTAMPTYLTSKQVDLNERITNEIIPLINEYLLTEVSFIEVFQFLIRFVKNFAINSAIDFVQDLVCHL